eukprot:160631_1
MEYLNEFSFRSINVMDKFPSIHRNPSIEVVDDIYPVKIAKGRGHIFRDNNKIICVSSSDKTIICSNFYLKPNNGSIYFEVVLETAKEIKIGWLNLTDEEYKENKVEESFIGWDGLQLLYYNSLKQSRTYSEKAWVKNDIVGVFINIEKKTTKFYLNGFDLGEAEKNLKVDQMHHLYPSFVLGKKK